MQELLSFKTTTKNLRTFCDDRMMRRFKQNLLYTFTYKGVSFRKVWLFKYLLILRSVWNNHSCLRTGNERKEVHNKNNGFYFLYIYLMHISVYALSKTVKENQIKFFTSSFVGTIDVRTGSDGWQMKHVKHVFNQMSLNHTIVVFWSPTVSEILKVKKVKKKANYSQKIKVLSLTIKSYADSNKTYFTHQHTSIYHLTVWLFKFVLFLKSYWEEFCFCLGTRNGLTKVLKTTESLSFLWMYLTYSIVYHSNETVEEKQFKLIITLFNASSKNLEWQLTNETHTFDIFSVKCISSIKVSFCNHLQFFRSCELKIWKKRKRYIWDINPEVEIVSSFYIA